MSPIARTRLILTVAVAAGFWLSIDPASQPVVVPAVAAEQLFSAERAVRHLAVIAAAPRPVGSEGHATTRAYLIEQVRQLGLTPDLQETTTALRFPGAEGFGVGTVRNVIVRIEGTASLGIVLLSGHYDGANTGPAAGDCGACVVTLLEVLRALHAGPRLRNDVIVVFSDAEEVGDLGAHAFATQHPWMPDVRVALNFEAMGTGGPAELYVTSPGNRRLVAAFARHAPDAMGSSFMAELSPPVTRNACDLQDYMDVGSAGLGFLFAGGTSAYHTILDDRERLDPKAVQHFGNYALGLVEHFGNDDLRDLRGNRDAVFFNVWPGLIAHYDQRWAVPLAVFGVLFLATTIVRGVKQRVLRPAGIALAAIAYLGGAILAVVTTAAVWWAIRLATANLQVFMVGHYQIGIYYVGLAAVAVAAMTGLGVLVRARLWRHEYLAGTVIALAACAVTTAWVFPGGSYLPVWPLLVSVAALRASLADGQRFTRVTIGLSAVAVVVTLAVLARNAAPESLFVAYVVRIDAMSGLPVLAIPTFLVALATGCLVSLWRLVDVTPVTSGWRRWCVPLIAMGVATATFGVATIRSGFDAAHPRPEYVRYELDVDTNTARWSTTDMHLGMWSSQFIRATTARDAAVWHGAPGGRISFQESAPVVSLPGPRLGVLSDRLHNGVRDLAVHLDSPRRAALLEVRIQAGGPVRRAGVANQKLDLADYMQATTGTLWLNYVALPAAGVVFNLQVDSAAPIRFELTDVTDGLPAIPGRPMPLRPSTTMPTPGGTWDGTTVRRTFTLPPPG